VVQGAAALRPRLQPLKAEPPFWGDRRSWASWRFGAQQPVHKNRVRRLLREHQRLVRPNPRLQAKRTPTAHHPQPTKPHEWWGIDMTKVLVEGCGWVSRVLVRAWSTKVIVGP
jgi:putative transposase